MKEPGAYAARLRGAISPAGCGLEHGAPDDSTGILDPLLERSIKENPVTLTLRCQNCGFSFIVTYLAASRNEAEAIPVACGHCRSTRWSAQAS